MNINSKENPKIISVEQIINILQTDMKMDQKYSSVLGNVHTLYKFLLCILDNATCCMACYVAHFT
jgi:hypothetical protein